MRVYGLALVFLLAAPLSAGAECAGADRPAANVRIASAEEPGERLVITGRVLAGASLEPVASARVYVYHTDAEGYYSAGRGMDNRNPRLCGIVVTDAAGNYRVETIRPGRYPDTRIPLHVHYVVSAKGRREQRFELRFADDPVLARAWAERQAAVAGETEPAWSSIRPVTVDEDGVRHVRRDLLLR